jgi:hypothetical protein
MRGSFSSSGSSMIELLMMLEEFCLVLNKPRMQTNEHELPSAALPSISEIPFLDSSVPAFLIQNISVTFVPFMVKRLFRQWRRCNGCEATARLSNQHAAATAPQSVTSVQSVV